MNRRHTKRLEALLRVILFVTDHPLTPANARVTVLQTSISAVVAEIQLHSGDQDTGRGISRGGTRDARRIAKDLRALMRLASDIGKALDEDAYPGLAEQLRMPGAAYAVLETRARTFVEVLTPIKQVFVDHMMPADFDLTLQGLIDEFVEARERKSAGRAEQVGGTAGIAEAVRRAMRLARELDAILSSAYAKNASLLAAWKSAARVHRVPEGEATPPTDPQAATPVGTPA